MELALIYILTVVLFLVILLSLGLQSKIVGKLSGVLLLIVGVLGVSLYGYAYFKLLESPVQAVARTLFSVFCMFLGRNEISAISAVPELKTPLMQCLIYMTHLLALYLTASAVVASIGTRLIRTLRLSFSRTKELHLIYGTSDESIAFGNDLLKKKMGMVVFIDPVQEKSYDNTVLQMGALLLSSGYGLDPSPAFLREIGVKPGKRQFHLYCLHSSPSMNLRYAQQMEEALNNAGVYPAQTSVTALLESEALGTTLQNTNERYGYGSVIALERHELSARLAMKACPPYETMTFDDHGKAKEDFEVLLVGFGKTGQALLRNLLQNGQFAGSEFKATVIDDNYRASTGYFFEQYPGIREHYQLNFAPYNARSIDAYEHVIRSIRKLNYAVVCTGNESINEEVAAELFTHFQNQRILVPVLECSSRKIRIRTLDQRIVTVDGVFDTDILCNETIDRLAMIINHSYHRSEGHTAEEDWAACDYFSRCSCRSSADYLDAFLHAAGTNREEVMKNGWNPDPETLDVLSQTEHMRWCAFHYAMGYKTMPEEIFRKRGEEHLKDPSVRISKDTVSRYHACLVPWDELKTLSEKEAEYTGRYTDYQAMDTNNVLAAGSLVQEAEAII